MTARPFAQLDAQAPPAHWRALLGWRRVRTVGILCALFALLFSFGWDGQLWQLVARVYGVPRAAWLAAIAYPLWRAGAVTPAVQGTAEACLAGVVLTPLVLPWRYIAHHYVRKPAERFRPAPHRPPPPNISTT